MRGEELTGIINNPHRLDQVTVNELIKLTRQYPWCASFRLLLLKKMHDANHPDFDNRLSLDALRVGDRSVLYRLIHAAQPEDEIESHVEPALAEDVIESQPESAPESVTPSATLSDTSVIEDHEEEKPGDDLIERFIKEEPRIVPRDGDFAESVRIAARSNEPALDLVTETLANIYLQQGDKTKAVKIFEQLSLTIPEKRSYFAARIAEVRNEANKL